MKVRKIQLKNGYKRFHHLTIDLGNDPKRIVALVGPNGCGKSSVFDGMLFLNNVELAKKLNLAQPTISQSAMRGGKIALDEDLKLLEQHKQ